jgi:hypothetical protein
MNYCRHFSVFIRLSKPVTVHYSVRKYSHVNSLCASPEWVHCRVLVSILVYWQAWHCSVCWSHTRVQTSSELSILHTESSACIHICYWILQVFFWANIKYSHVTSLCASPEWVHCRGLVSILVYWQAWHCSVCWSHTCVQTSSELSILHTESWACIHICYWILQVFFWANIWHHWIIQHYISYSASDTTSIYFFLQKPHTRGGGGGMLTQRNIFLQENTKFCYLVH